MSSKDSSMNEKRVGFSLPSDRCCRAVAREDNGVVGQRKQLLADAFQEKLSFASGKIPATDALPEKDVSAHENSFFEKVDTHAAGAMSRHVVDSHRSAEELGRSVLVNKIVRVERVNLEFKAPTPEKFLVSYHGGSLGMHRRLAFMALNDCRGVGDMVKVAMRYNQQAHLFACESRICSLRSVEKDAAFRRPVVEAIGVEHAARKGFEPIHKKMVREKMIWQFDFPTSVCKFFTSPNR